MCGIRFSYLIVFVINQRRQAVFFTDAVCERLNIFFPVFLFITVFISTHPVHRIKDNMAVHMFLIRMDRKNIVIIFSQIFFTKIIYHRIGFFFCSFPWRKRDHKMVSLSSSFLFPFLFCINHYLIHFLRGRPGISPDHPFCFIWVHDVRNTIF